MWFGRWCLMVVVKPRWFWFIRAEAPCWKGEVQIWRVVLVWQAAAPTKEGT
jgi:hypothetical protein